MAKSTTSPFFTKNSPRDGSGNPMLIGGAFVTADETGTPITSPKTVSSSTVTFVVPANAIQMIIANNANALRISDKSDMSTYFTLPASTTGFVIDCADMANIYMVRDSTDVVVQFMFVTL